MRVRLRFLRSVRRVRPLYDGSLGRGVAMRGRLWLGGDAATLPDAVLVVDGQGRVAHVYDDAEDAVPRLPEGLPLLGGAGCWVSPGVVDAHVHLAFGSPERALAGGVVALRDLGAPPVLARGWRSAGPPCCAVAGPVVTAPGGYPTRSWGADGFGALAGSPQQARDVVRVLAADGVDLVKVALEPGGGAPVPSPEVLRALVDAAHDAGLPVTAHALTVEMVTRALDAGVDELAHTPVEPLPASLLARLATTMTPVVSTLQTLAAGGAGRGALANAAALHAAGVPLLYGTDLGNTGTSPGVDPRELDRLADAGLGRAGALRRAVEGARWAVGLQEATPGRVVIGEPAALVLLPDDPLAEPAAWRAPLAVVAGARLVR